MSDIAHVRWLSKPSLTRPVMITAFTGWNDAADAASNAVRNLIEGWGAQPLAEIDPEMFTDFATIRPQILMPVISIICLVGVYSVSSSLFDVELLMAFGLLGYLMRKLDYPSAPLILGLVLGDGMERALRQALMMSQGDLSILVARPISAVMLSLAALMLLLPLFGRLNRWRINALEQSESES